MNDLGLFLISPSYFFVENFGSFMNIECNRCHANNHIENIFVECVNCRADLSDIYTQNINSQNTFLKNLFKIGIATVILTLISVFAYEFLLRDKVFSQALNPVIF